MDKLIDQHNKRLLGRFIKTIKAIEKNSYLNGDPVDESRKIRNSFERIRESLREAGLHPQQRVAQLGLLLDMQEILEKIEQIGILITSSTAPIPEKVRTDIAEALKAVYNYIEKLSELDVFNHGPSAWDKTSILKDFNRDKVILMDRISLIRKNILLSQNPLSERVFINRILSNISKVIILTQEAIETSMAAARKASRHKI